MDAMDAIVPGAASEVEAQDKLAHRKNSKEVLSTCKSDSLIDETMGRLLRKIRKIANRRKRSRTRSDATGRDCADCAALMTKVDGELFLAAR